MSPDLDRIVLAVQACPAVAGLHSGRLGETATPLRVGTLFGVLVADATITIGVVGRYPSSVAEIAAQVRAAVTPHTCGMTVIVNVEDLHVPEQEPGAVPDDRPLPT